MNKKIFIIIGVLVVLVILLFPKVEALNDGGTKIYKSLIYEVTKAHKIRTERYIVKGTIVKILGKEIYCDIPKDVEIIVDGKETVSIDKKYEKTIDNITLSLAIPDEWKYEELKRNSENDFYKYALKIYKENENKYAILYYYQQVFGVCGTGRTSKQINLDNGNKATVGYYDGSDIWEDISFYETNKYIAILNYGLNKEEAEEFLNIVKTINISKNNIENEVELLLKEETLSSKGATFILKNNTDNQYWYGPDYYIDVKKDGKWAEIELDSPLVWNSIAYILKANEEKELNIDWSYGYGELKSGEYRLVKSTFKEEDRPIDETKKIYLYSEFEIK